MKPEQALMRNPKKTLFPTFLLNRLLFCANFTFPKKCANSHHWVHLYRTTPTFFWTRNCPGIWMTRQKPNLWISNNQNTTLHCCKQKVNVNLCTAGSNVIFTIFGSLLLLSDKPKKILLQANEKKVFFLCFLRFFVKSAFLTN